VIEERAIVVASQGNHVWIETQRQSTCGNCSVNKGCGTAVLSSVLGNRRTRIQAKNELANLKPGDVVIVGMEDSALLHSAAAFFAVPVVSMLLAAMVGSAVLRIFGVAEGEGVRVLLGIMGLFLGVVWTRMWAHRKQSGGNYDLHILRRELPKKDFVPLIRRSEI